MFAQNRLLLESAWLLPRCFGLVRLGWRQCIHFKSIWWCICLWNWLWKWKKWENVFTHLDNMYSKSSKKRVLWKEGSPALHNRWLFPSCFIWFDNSPTII